MKRNLEQELVILRGIFSLGLTLLIGYVTYKALEKLDLQYFDGFNILVWVVLAGYVLSSWLVKKSQRKMDSANLQDGK